MDVPAQPRSAPQVRAFVRHYAGSVGFPPDDIAEIEVAVGEAVTNAILYGHHTESPTETIEISLGLAGPVLFVEVRDFGPGFDPDSVPHTGIDDVDSVGGRGLPLMQALMDHVDMRYDGTGMRVRMERSLPVCAPCR